MLDILFNTCIKSDVVAQNKVSWSNSSEADFERRKIERSLPWGKGGQVGLGWLRLCRLRLSEDLSPPLATVKCLAGLSWCCSRRRAPPPSKL